MSTTYINTISSISFFHHHFSQYFRNSWRKVQNFVERKFVGIFTKISITFSYGIGITKLLSCWKSCYEGYVVTWSRNYFGFSNIYSSCDIHKGMQHHHHSLHNEFKYIYQYIGSHTKIKYELYPWETCAITRESQKHQPYIFKDKNMKK